ncbi:MAG: tRNA-dihydrouridine synthase family protein [Kofleriaceae bacterium]|nr:tRNA-dihydrouridine synthase family protein [Kofleriaceae bacterium]MBE7454513.1 tRNA-dihydrouridine synthase family protein [Kofleriaceae bacterium]MCL4224957.1 tRNA-dihydrouridine synthase family protein [Myxococcales bacterium]
MNPVAAILAEAPVVLAPMEDVTDAAFRRVARGLGAALCVTEFIRAEQVIAGAALARRKAALAADDRPTAIQIYGADAGLLMEAAVIAARARPSFLDLNCGCWLPRVARGGAGAGWLRDPAAMVAMVRRVVAAVDLPVTVKTRIGFGPESAMPIVDLARRLEDAGAAALTIHCRTAHAGHDGAADWAWARRAREVVAIPVVVNGDVRDADDAVRALAETGCAGVMIGRAAIQHPWIFAEARARLAGAPPPPPPDDGERARVYAALLDANVAARGERWGVQVTRRHLPLLGPLAARLRARLLAASTRAATRDVLAGVDHAAPAAATA